MNIYLTAGAVFFCGCIFIVSWAAYKETQNYRTWESCDPSSLKAAQKDSLFND